MNLKVIFLSLLFLVPLSVLAEPYYAAWNGVNCNACHTNQTGGWLRNNFGKNFGNQLATFDWQGLSTAVKGANKVLPAALTVGLDIHESYAETFFQKPVTNVNGFLSGPGYGLYPNGGRQALEIGVKANQDLSGVLTYRLDDYSTKEMYILWSNLPADGYLKLGKFTVPYGLELADDNSLVRSALGFSFDQNPAEGLEGGIYPEPAFLNFAFFNGDPTTSDKAFSGKGGFQGDGWALAGSVFGQNLDLTTQTLRYGVFGWGRISPVVILAEFDQGTNGLTAVSQDNLQAYHISAEGNLGFDCYLRLVTEWLWDSIGTNPASGLRHVASFRCYPVQNLKFQLDLTRVVPSSSNPNYIQLGPIEDMVVADAYFFY
jgi:hypothetical protein